MGGFVKLVSDIVESSIWSEDSDTCKVWITMLALSDPTGFVRGSDGWLAYKCRVGEQKTALALEKFQSPDLTSRTPDFEGRRIRKVVGGYVILNYEFYRNNCERSDSSDTGYVYYVLDANEIKIGFSTNPWARIKELRVARPNATVVATERGNRTTEILRHEQFAKHRLKGEWFTFHNEIKVFVESLGSEPEPSLRSKKSTTSNYSPTTPASASASASVPASVPHTVQTPSNPPAHRETPPEPKGYHKDARTVLYLLNEATGRHFRETDANLKAISYRLKEPGVDLDGVKQMIKRQCQRWKGSRMEEYLRPETLFGKTKFDSYYASKDLPIHENDEATRPRGDERNFGTGVDTSANGERTAALIAAKNGGQTSMPL